MVKTTIFANIKINNYISNKKETIIFNQKSTLFNQIHFTYHSDTGRMSKPV